MRTRLCCPAGRLLVPVRAGWLVCPREVEVMAPIVGHRRAVQSARYARGSAELFARAAEPEPGKASIVAAPILPSAVLADAMAPAVFAPSLLSAVLADGAAGD